MPKIKHVQTKQIITVAAAPRFVNGIWECGDQRFTDPGAKAYAPVIEPPTVGPIAFKLLFTPAERITAEKLKATDPGINDFWTLLDDPRTDVVDLALESVQAAVRHTLEGVKAAGVEVDVDARLAQILTGAVQ